MELEVLSSFVDGELGDSDELELRRHLETCAECQRRIAVLEGLKRAVASAAEIHPLPGSLKEALTLPAGQRSRPLAGSILLGVTGCAAAIVFGAALWMWPLAPNGRATAPLVDELMRDHLRYAISSNELEYATGDLELLARWFTDHLGYRVNLPQLANSRIVGGRRCAIAGRRVALALYEQGRDGRRISVYVLPAGTLSASDRSAFHEPGKQTGARCCEREGAYRVCLQPETALETVWVEPRDGAPPA